MRRIGLLVMLCLILPPALLTPHASSHAAPAAQPAPVQLRGNDPAQLFAAPQTIGAGGELQLTIDAQSLFDTPHRVIAQASGAVLASGFVDFDGRARYTVALPGLGAGQHTLALQIPIGGGTWTTLATAAIIVLGPLSVVPTPAFGPPGTVVAVQVSNALPQGHLRIEYAGQAVGAPQPSRGPGQYLFTVPADRPSPLGVATTLKVIQLIDGKPVNTGNANFGSRATANGTPYSVSGVTVVTAQARTGEPVAVTGRLSRALEGPASGYQATLVWKNADGQVFPLQTQSAVFNADGTFRVTASAPRLTGSDPAVTARNGQVALLVKTPVNDLVMPYQTIAVDESLSLNVRVVDRQTNEVLPTAVVTVRALPPENCTEHDFEQDHISPLPFDPGYPAQNQLHAAMTQQGYHQGGWIAGMDANQPNVRQVNAQGVATFGLIEEFPLLSAAPLGGGVAGAFLQRPAAAGFSAAPASEEICLHTHEMLYGFSAYVNEDFPGDDGVYGYADGGEAAWYTPENKLFNTQSGPIPSGQPLVIKLDRVAKPFEGIDNIKGAISKTKEQSGGAVYAGAISVKNAPAGTQLVGVSNIALEVKFRVSNTDLNNITVHKVQIFVNNVAATSVLTRSITGGREWVATIANPYGTFDAGNIPIELKVTSTRVIGQYRETASQSNSINLKLGKIPAWFTQAGATERRITYDPDLLGLVFHARVPGKSQALNSAPLPQVGALNNNTGAGSQVIDMQVDALGGQTIAMQAQTSTTALNQGGAPAALPQQIAGAGDFPMRTCKASPLLMCFDKNAPAETVTIVDTGWVPVARNAWGIWPIASATMGVDLWFKAELLASGFIAVTKDGVTNSQLLLKPTATVGVQAWFDLSVLGGLVEASLTAQAIMALSLPVTLSNFHDPSRAGASVSSPTLSYQLDLFWHAKVGSCTIALCKEDDGVIHVIPYDQIPRPASQFRQAPPPAEPPRLPSAIDSDPSGNTMTVWRSTSGAIVSAERTSRVTRPVTVATGLLIGAPKLAFYDDNDAMAIWTQSAQTSIQVINAQPITETLKSMHVRYAAWDGRSRTWSAPQALTAASTGDGSLTLAACPANTGSCGETGQALAAWVHDTTGALNSRNFKIQYRLWESGVWGPLMTLDAANAASDAQPQALFVNGEPWIGFIRDTDHRLATLADRRFAYAVLSPTPTVRIPTVPAGVVEFSLVGHENGNASLAYTLDESGTGGIVSNRNYLYLAKSVGNLWTSRKLTDQYGRPMRAERPTLIQNAAAESTIIFRGVGFGPDLQGKWSYHGEPVGMQSGTGDLVRLVVSDGASNITPAYLTADGKVNWEPSVSYDAVRDLVHVSVVKGVGPALQARPGAERAVAAFAPLLADEAIVQASLPASMPDFLIDGASSAQRYPLPNQAMTVAVRVGNQGSGWTAGAAPLRVTASWDGPHGLKPAVASATISPTLAAGQLLTVTLSLNAPADTLRAHTLHLTVNPIYAVNELEGANNTFQLAAGGLPAPSNGNARTQQGSRFVQFNWDRPRDARVTAFRMYRAEGRDAFNAVGSTLVDGFVDVTAKPNTAYRYAVSAVAATGQESPLLELPPVQTLRFRAFLPVVRR